MTGAALSQKGRLRRAEMIETALRVLSERGYRDTSLRAIGRELGVQPAHILHYFPTREALLEAVITAWDDQPFDLQEGKNFLLTWPEIVCRNATIPGLVHLYTAFAAEASGPGHPSREFFQRRYELVRNLVVEDIEKGILEGRYVTALRPEQIAVILISLSDGLQLQWLIDPSIDMAEELKAAIIRLTTV